MATEHRYAVLLLCVFSTSLAHADDPPAPEPGASSRYASKVRGDAADALRRESGSSTVITPQEIEKAQLETTGELFTRVPSLQVRQEDPSGFRLNIGVRGLSPARSRLVLVEEDGIPVVVSPYGEPELYYMTAVERIQSVDVVKGADVLEYGPQTVGAVIKLHTFAPTDKPDWYTALSLGERGYGEVISRYTNTIRGIGVVAQVFHKWGDGYRNMPFSATDVMGKVQFATGVGGTLKIKVAFHDEDAHTTYTGLTDTMYQQDPTQDTVAPDDHFAIQRFELGLQHEQRFNANTKLRTAAFFYQMDTVLRLQDFDRARLPQVDYVRIPDPTGLFFRSTTSIRDRVYDVVGGSAELEQRFNTGFVKHKVLLGGRVMYDMARRKLSTGQIPTANSGDLVTDDQTDIVGLSGWVEDQVALSHLLIVTPAFRVEHARSTKHTYRISDDNTAPRDVDITGNSTATGLMPGVSVSLGKPAFNAFTSLYRGYSGPRVSQSITPNGQDANLDPETSTNYEIGLRGRHGRWFNAEADAFLINFDNQLVSNNPLSGSTSEFIDGGKTQHIGAETTAKLRVGTALHLPVEIDLSGHYTFVRSHFVGGSFDGNVVPYSPTHTAEIVLDLAHRWGVSAQVAFSYVGSQFADEKNTVEPGPTGLDGRIDAYTALDVNARYRNARTGLSLSVAVKNALNRVYISDRLPNGIFTSGFRQIFATLAWSAGD